MSAEAVAEAPPAEGDGGGAAPVEEAKAEAPEAAPAAEEQAPQEAAAEAPPQAAEEGAPEQAAPEAPAAPAGEEAPAAAGEEAPAAAVEEAFAAAGEVAPAAPEEVAPAAPEEVAPAAPEEAPPAAPVDEEGQRSVTTQVVKELLGIALKEAEGVHKTVTIEGEKKRDELKSDEHIAKPILSGAMPGIEESGVVKPRPVPSEFKKDSLASRDRKSKFSMAKVHKSSFRFRTISGSALAIRTGAEKGPKYENSYWLTPKARFNVDKVITMLREVVDDRISKITEKPKFQEISSSIVTETLAKIKLMAFDRYRFVCVCLVGEKSDQALRCSFRMLWDADHDNYAWYTVEQTRLFLVASVFGIYFD